MCEPALNYRTETFRYAERKSNHNCIVTGGRHLGGKLFVYIHFLPRRQLIVDTFHSLCVTFSD
ncbi:hypothetical protein E2C01_039371 [Portunus trituberculatus]|uniref:Uncharacterized protein n=1 Tax=Portunus trituberculatus TaxID=210409 RepID=A0A5B7FJI4_PORTR|nr:hypothetical protein [Portunus trituberculatus]